MPPDDRVLSPHERVALERAVGRLLPGARAVADGFELVAPARPDEPGGDRTGDRDVDVVARLVVGFGALPDDVPSWRLAPRFPGSFLHGALQLSAGREDRANVDERAGRAPLPEGLPPPLEPDWHYAAMTLRPEATRDARNGGERCGRRVAVYARGAAGDVAEANGEAAAIADLCTSLHGPFALDVIGDGDGPARLVARLARAHGIEARRVACDRDSPRAFFASLAGVDVAVFSAGDGRLADAIEIGVPVWLAASATGDGSPAFASTPRERGGASRSDPVGDPVGALDPNDVDIRRQRAGLARALDPSRDGALVENDPQALHRALRDRFAAVGIEPRLVVPPVDAPVIARRPDDASRPAGGRLGLDGPRRKLAKFRESPARFVRDSRLPVLRRLTGGRR